MATKLVARCETRLQVKKEDKWNKHLWDWD